MPCVVNVLLHLLIFFVGAFFLVSHNWLSEKVDAILAKARLPEVLTTRVRTGWAYFSTLITGAGGVIILTAGVIYLGIDLFTIMFEGCR
jgi:hypothetical protein